MTKIIITGGAGFIGTHLAERLVRDHHVVLLDNFRRDALQLAPGLEEQGRIEVVRGDVLDRSTLEPVLAGADAVLHLAAIAGVSSYYREPLRTLQVNILGTANMLECAAAAGVGKFVHFSTSEVFGSDAAFVHEESGFRIGTVADRRWTYATSKLASEQFVLRAGEEYGFEATVLRPFNVYGPRQVGEGAISNFCRAALSGGPLTVYGDGAAVRAWLYVEDMVDAVAAALSSPDAAGRSFNIGNPTAIDSTRGLAGRVARLAPGVDVVTKPVDRAEVRVRIPAIHAARDVLGFEPAVDLDEGLERTFTWFKEQGADL